MSNQCLIAAELAKQPIWEGDQWPNCGSSGIVNAFPNQTLQNFAALFLSPFTSSSVILLGFLYSHRPHCSIKLLQPALFCMLGGPLSLKLVGFRLQGACFMFGI